MTSAITREITSVSTCMTMSYMYLLILFL
jgi:hypothetical protein